MRSGQVVVVLLFLAAFVGAWLGPAGERRDPDLGPSVAYFRYALSRVSAPRVSLRVAGHEPSAALMAQFRGVETSGGVVVELARLDWQGSDDDVVCTGTVDGKALVVEFVLDPSGKWIVKPST